MKKLLVLVVFGLVLGIAQMSFAKTLVDVPSGHWAEDAVQRLFDSGIIEGYPTGDYKGNQPLTRYEYAMVVDRIMQRLESDYCTKDECGAGMQEGELDEIKDIVKKLAAEFKDELAALKVKVDENSEKIEKLENDVANYRIGNIIVTGSIRQRIDVPNTDLDVAGTNPTVLDFGTSYYTPVYDPAGVTLLASGNDLEAGYEMLPAITFAGMAGENVDFSIGLSQSIRSSPMGYNSAYEENGELVINHAYADIDFSSSVRELDLLKLKSGYQQFAFGPYGMLVDNSGMVSNAGLKLDIAKDIVSLTGIGAMANMAGGNEGLTAVTADPYAALRLGLDTRWVNVGVNFLANGVLKEKGWGADIVAPILRHSPFLPELRAEYMTVTDLTSGVTVPSGADDNSFMVGLDLYKNKRAGLTLSYADLPATVALSSMDGNPFTEYGVSCPAGLDVAPVNDVCYSYESGRMLFPAGFEGIGVEASYIVFGDVTLAAKGVLGNFAGGGRTLSTVPASTDPYADGNDYPGFGAFSVTKPINDKSQFRIEYQQQGADPILLNRIRGELLISF